MSIASKLIDKLKFRRKLNDFRSTDDGQIDEHFLRIKDNFEPHHTYVACFIYLSSEHTHIPKGSRKKVLFLATRPLRPSPPL